MIFIGGVLGYRYYLKKSNTPQIEKKIVRKVIGLKNNGMMMILAENVSGYEIIKSQASVWPKKKSRI